jgi:hypothetical protein
MKTSELVGAQLDWAVAKCEGAFGLKQRLDYETKPWQCSFTDEDTCKVYNYFLNELEYSSDWSMGGPIIEREEIALDKDEKWFASSSGGCRHGSGPTLLIAAMRCYVASKLGDEVELPKGL